MTGDFSFGDELDFTENHHSSCGGGDFLVVCIRCGRFQLMCSKCLSKVRAVCPCQEENLEKK